MTTPPPPAYPPPPPAYPPPPPVPARRTSGAAVASLVLGLLGILGGWCLCGLPSLLAIIFGHLGSARTRSGEVAGHGAAVAGLVLGYVLVLPTAAATLLFLLANPADVADVVRGLSDFLRGLVG